MRVALDHARVRNGQVREPPRDLLIHGVARVAMNHRFGEFARCQRHLEFVVGEAIWPGHFDVETGIERGRRGTRAEKPVGFDEAFESPFLAQNFREQLRVLTAVHAVHLVVRAHHRRRAGLDDAAFEVRQIQFVQRARSDVRAHLEARVFEIVQREVFRAGQHVILRAADERHRHRAHVMRIFRVGLLRPAPSRMAQQIDGGREQHVAALGRDFQRDRETDAPLEFDVERRRARDRHRKRSRFAGARAARTIHHLVRRQIERLVAARVVEALDRTRRMAAQFVDLLRQRHPREQRVDLARDRVVIDVEPFVAPVNRGGVEGEDTFHVEFLRADGRIQSPPSSQGRRTESFARVRLASEVDYVTQSSDGLAVSRSNQPRGSTYE